jgi:cell shape-determining protein MreD
MKDFLKYATTGNRAVMYPTIGAMVTLSQVFLYVEGGVFAYLLAIVATGVLSGIVYIDYQEFKRLKDWMREEEEDVRSE